MSTDQIIVYLIIGALAGSLAGMLVRRDKKGYGPLLNIVIGLIGAFIGGFLFDVLEIEVGLGEIAITAEDLLAAFVGSLILLVLVSYLRRK